MFFIQRLKMKLFFLISSSYTVDLFKMLSQISFSPSSNNSCSFLNCHSFNTFIKLLFFLIRPLSSFLLFLFIISLIFNSIHISFIPQLLHFTRFQHVIIKLFCYDVYLINRNLSNLIYIPYAYSPIHISSLTLKHFQ